MFVSHFAEFLIKQNLQHLIVHVTNHCNFRCSHCFIDFSPKTDLTLAEYKELGKSVGRLFWLDIGGGEPFLRKDLVEIISNFDAEVVQIPTNASLPDQVVETVRALTDRIDSEITISISIDGPKEKHEEIRRAKGNWDQVWTTFEKLRQIKKIKIKINTVLNNKNCDKILDLMRFVRQKEPDFHSIILLRGEPMSPEFDLPSFTKLESLAPKIFEILATYDYGKGGVVGGILRNYHRYLWNTSLRTLKEKTQVIPCVAGRAHMVVLGNGDVSSCEMLTPVGNIQRQGWNEIMMSESMKQQKSDIRAKKCHCTHNCAMFDSIVFRLASLTHLIHESI